MEQIVYNIYFEIDEYHPIKGQLSFILLVYAGLLLGTHSMEAPSQQQPSYARTIHSLKAQTVEVAWILW
jgi:hypothetical protein